MLLILAGITMSSLTGENGLLEKIQEAKQRTENAQKNENSILDEYVNNLNTYSSNNPNIQIGNNLNYSEEERVVGKWIDGKNIYAKTITIGTVASGWHNINLDGEYGIIDNSGNTVVDFKCIVLLSNNGDATKYWRNVPSVSGYDGSDAYALNIRFIPERFDLSVGTNMQVHRGHLTIYYTKAI